MYAYAKQAGGKAYDSSTGFKMPGGGVLNPDAAWVRAERVERFARETGSWPLVPDVVVEVASPTDGWPRVRARIDAYLAAGAGYAIAIDAETCERYEQGDAPAGLVIDVEAILSA